MTTISSLTGASNNGYNTLVTSANPIAQTSQTGLAQAAVNLSVVGNIVATLGGGSSSALTYDAAGLLNSFVQAGTATSPTPTTSSNANPQATAQNATDQGIVNTLPSSATASGVYDSSGSLQGVSSNVSANWASVLKANPSLTSVLTSDYFNQGIVGTLSTSA